MGSRRNTELFLLVAAAFPVVLLYAMYVVNTGAELSFTTLAVPLGLFAAFTAAHIAARIFAPGADPAILPVVFLLSGIGITFVTRLAPSLAINQLMILFASIVLMAVTLALVKNLDMVRRYKYTFGIIGIVLLILPMFIGTEVYGSKLWIEIPGVGSFQPGEFAKVFLVLFLAGYLSENRELLSISNHSILGLKIPRLRLLMPLFVVWGICMAIVAFETDLGSALLFFAFFVIMIYVATGRVSYVPRAVSPTSSSVWSCCFWAALRCTRSWVTCRCASTPGSTRSPTRRAAATSSCSRCSRSLTAAWSAWASAAAWPP